MSDMDAHLLIVDDDERIRDLLKKVPDAERVSGDRRARCGACKRRVLSGLDFDMIVHGCDDARRGWCEPDQSRCARPTALRSFS